MSFLHIADIHLGYQQYGLSERFNDFSRAFLHLVDSAVARRVDFVLLAGDLFENRAVDPLTMRVAIRGFSRLQEAGIPVVAVEGNHEGATYRDQFSWVDFLDALGYLRLLNYRPQEGLQAYGENGGAYIDLPSGVRVYGMKYYGAATGQVLAAFAADLAQADHSGVDFAILTAHTGLEGEMAHVRGSAYEEFAPLRERIDYVALGHFHKPYAVDNWLFNPGSPETCGMEEVAWPERGAYLVEIRPERTPKHQAELLTVPRRPFHRFTITADFLADPNMVYDAVRALISQQSGKVAVEPQPVIELTLTGTLPFSRYDLDLTYIQDVLAEAWSPLGQPRVINRTTPTEFEVNVDTEASRPELERHILQELLERDVRFRSGADAWAEGALELKRLALSGGPPEAIVAHLR
ncbi:MAG: DNA repair exonuclease, partial [Anaerolineae bacterium]|nr:DNA repair exonuclease [Anaerolineae bacterium]